MTSDNNRKRRTSASSGRNSSGTRKRSTSGTQNRNTAKSSSSGRKSSSSGKRNTNSKNATKRQRIVEEEEYEFDYVKTLIYIGVFALFIIMFLFALGIFDGGFGVFITKAVKGLFGVDAYVIPVIGIGFTVYLIFKNMTKKTVFDIVSAVVLAAGIGMLATAIAYPSISAYSYGESVKLFYLDGKGGGVIFASLAYLIDKSCGRALVWILSIVMLVASVAVMFGKYIVKLFNFLLEKYSNLDDAEEDPSETQYKLREIRKLKANEAANRKPKISYKINDEEEEAEKETFREEEKIIDVPPTQIRSFFEKDDDDEEEAEDVKPAKKTKEKKESNDIHQIVAKDVEKKVTDDEIKPINVYSQNRPLLSEEPKEEPNEEKLKFTEVEKPAVSLTDNSRLMLENNQSAFEEVKVKSIYETNDDKKVEKSNKPYKFPPISLLNKGEKGSKVKNDNIIETAKKLKETLSTFGVEVTIDPNNCSKGPAVTRYELTPAPGVKVSRIVSLSDDIKLSLGAADIRIEAPIPGKSAVGIEVPNSESSAVPFRDLIESNEFASSKSKISFAVGKDLAGQVVIADIAKMPHLLIAGATGSGKSVCINTIIMSILYKAHPDDVKLILIDPKVVELSVYNKIPHLLTDVVTDPKKASASLKFGVKEMEERYKLFADAGVRDLKGYNEKKAEEPDGKILPQIVIIVDELADLMMVAGKEVEESICRLAQLARAAGIHLIIATQRPSVDVITGLIKANMPSRIAFSVSSGIDSRTILDTNGAEKLLGKGDMLYFPQGMNKPSRVQGCYVSDEEVLNVVDFIKSQKIIVSSEGINEFLESGGISGTVEAPGGDLDEFFAQAGLFIIGKEKASIGALQRAFKIGFNRAARIMDQLEAKGVVGPEEGTKPRKILMSEAEFKQMMGIQS
ncbi:MAG: DNA translocase FtsK [Lachnospiraceae bacterium]|nr:DNA translocase FtsK [Lachnospiraceae bacterium]